MKNVSKNTNKQHGLKKLSNLDLSTIRGGTQNRSIDEGEALPPIMKS